MLKQFCEGKAPLELIEEREALFHLLPSTTPQRLHKKTSSYTINPHTRYPNFSLVPPSDISYLFDSDTQPSRRQQRITESPLTGLCVCVCVCVCVTGSKFSTKPSPCATVLINLGCFYSQYSAPMSLLLWLV